MFRSMGWRWKCGAQILYGEQSVFAREPQPMAVERFTTDDLRDYHAMWERPDNAVLGICGDFQVSVYYAAPPSSSATVSLKGERVAWGVATRGWSGEATVSKTKEVKERHGYAKGQSFFVSQLDKFAPVRASGTSPFSREKSIGCTARIARIRQHAQLHPGIVQGWRACTHAQPDYPTRGAPPAAARQLHLPTYAA